MMKASVLASIAAVAQSELCCQTCPDGQQKYYSVDMKHGHCGEACIDPSKFGIFHVFESNLTIADGSTGYQSCADLGWPVYTETVTHGDPLKILQVTLDLYDRDSGYGQVTYAIMDLYPGYTGDLQVVGSVSVDQSGDNIVLSWRLSGLEADLCKTPPEGVGNACGIHIHSGTTCDDSSGVGGHYYMENIGADPWSPVVFTPNVLGDSTSSGNNIVIGHSLTDVLGRAMVVHDHTGGRVACGIIHAAPAAKASLDNYLV